MFNIKKEIEEITQREIFMAIHEQKGHCLTEHLLDNRELREKLWEKKKMNHSEEITMATRFFSEDSALTLIQELLHRHIDDIIKWRKMLDYPYLEIQETFSESTGEGIAKGTDYDRLIEVHGLRIVLIAGDSIGRAFYIKTAYPINVFEDNDEIFDAMDEWQEQKRKRKLA